LANGPLDRRRHVRPDLLQRGDVSCFDRSPVPFQNLVDECAVVHAWTLVDGRCGGGGWRRLRPPRWRRGGGGGGGGEGGGGWWGVGAWTVRRRKRRGPAAGLPGEARS